MRTSFGQIAQLVEQRIENPRVGGSIPPLATTIQRPTVLGWAFSFVRPAGRTHLGVEVLYSPGKGKS